MKIRTTFFIFCISLLSGACRQVATESRVQPISFEVGSSMIADTFFLDSLSLFMPETNEEALINSIDRVYESNGRYFILDKRMKQVLCYTLSGKHLFTIHAVENGKGEYVDLFDIAIDEAENKLLLLTYPSQILYYDLEGTYLSSYPLDDMYQSFAVDKGFIYLRNDTYANGVVSDYSLIVINKETGKQTSLLEPLYETAPFCSSGNYQITNTASVLFARKFDNHIYRITGESIEPLYMVDWKDKAFPESDKQRQFQCNDLNQFCYQGKYVYTMTDLCDTPSYLLFRTNQPGMCLLSKATSTVNNYQVIINTDYQLPLPNYMSVEGKQSRIFFIYSSEVLCEQKKLSAEEDINEKMSSLLGRIKEGDNPVIFTYHVK